MVESLIESLKNKTKDLADKALTGYYIFLIVAVAAIGILVGLVFLKELFFWFLEQMFS